MEGGRSRGTSARYVLAHRRVPTHLFSRPRWSFLIRRECISPRFMPIQRMTSVSSVLPMGDPFHRSRLGFRQSSFTHSVRAIRRPCPTTLSDMSRFLSVLLFPLVFTARLADSSGTSPWFLLSLTGISRSASRRTPCGQLSPHSAF